MILSAITNYVFFKGLKALLLSDFDLKSVLNGSTKESFGTVIIDCIIFVLFSLVIIFFVRRFITFKAPLTFTFLVAFSLFLTTIKASATPASTFSITFDFNCTSGKTTLAFILTFLMLTSIGLCAVLSFSFIKLIIA